MKRFLAVTISQIFNPLLAWPIFITLLLLATGLSGQQQQFLGISLGLLELVLPVVLLGLFIKLGWISDMDITKVKERRLFFVIIVALHVLSTYLVWRYGTALAGELRLLALAVELLGTLITFGWKISGHLAASSFVIMVVLMVCGLQWWPLVLLLPFIAWSRVVLHKHTVAQTIAGACLPFIILVGVALMNFHVLVV